MLQPARVRDDGRTGLAVSDFFDFSVYVDAAQRRHPRVVRRAVPAAARDRVPRPGVLLRASTPRSPTTRPSTEAERIWDTINGPNLAQNILPTRSRATLVLRKDRDHSVRYVRLRKL